MPMHPLTSFTHWGQEAPYRAGCPKYDRPAIVMPARSKTGLVAARRGDLAHLDDGIAVIFEGSRAQFGARFLCGGDSNDVAILLDARAYGGICEKCVDAAAGPCVYRCRDAAQVLLYIGSAERWLPRLSQHQGRTAWWPEVADVQVEHYRSIFEARAAEGLAIADEQPLYNKRRKARVYPRSHMATA
jgi:hypothetical protein